jgi:hypothetical protein
MTSARRAVVLTAFGLFALTLVFRPVTRFLPTELTEEGFDAGALLFAVPGIVVVLAMLVAGLSLVRRTDTDADTSLGDVVTTNGGDTSRPGGHSPELGQRNDDSTVDRGGGWSGDRFLTGQGGTRNRGFEIEEQPPETDVDDHLRYLREQLDGDDAEAVAGDTSANGRPDSDQPASTGKAQIPPACPQPYCDADWQTSGLLSGGTRYEVISDGEQVRCGECGGITTLE